MNKRQLIVAISFFVIFLNGCAHIYTLGDPDWRVQDLPTMQVKGNIAVAMHLLTPEEKIKYHRDYGKNIVPVYLVVSNPTQHKVLVDVEDLARISETIIDEIGKQRIEKQKDNSLRPTEGIAQALIIPVFPLHLAAAGIKELERRPRSVLYFNLTDTFGSNRESVFALR